IHQESRFVVHVEAAALPARGRLRPRDLERKRKLEAKEGVRLSGSREAVKRCFEVLAHALSRGTPAVIVTDEKSSYATVLAETMAGRFVHEQRSGKLPKTMSNALWPINHTLAMLRDGPSRLVRETWAASKERGWLAQHVWIWIAYRNYIRCFTNKQRHTTSALKAGLVSRMFSKTNFFEWRVFPNA